MPRTLSAPSSSHICASGSPSIPREHVQNHALLQRALRAETDALLAKLAALARRGNVPAVGGHCPLWPAGGMGGLGPARLTTSSRTAAGGWRVKAIGVLKGEKELDTCRRLLAKILGKSGEAFVKSLATNQTQF